MQRLRCTMSGCISDSCCVIEISYLATGIESSRMCSQQVIKVLHHVFFPYCGQCCIDNSTCVVRLWSCCYTWLWNAIMMSAGWGQNFYAIEDDNCPQRAGNCVTTRKLPPFCSKHSVIRRVMTIKSITLLTKSGWGQRFSTCCSLCHCPWPNAGPCKKHALCLSPRSHLSVCQSVLSAQATAHSKQKVTDWLDNASVRP